MFVTRISIYREGTGSYSYQKPTAETPYKATVEVQGTNSKVELNLSEEMSRQIVAVIAAEIAAAGKRTAEMMTAEVIQGAALPAPGVA